VALPADRAIGLGRPRPRLRSVPRTRRRRSLPFLILSALLVAGLVLMLISVQALLAQGAFRVSALGVRAERLELESDLLRLRLARLSSPERLAAAALRNGLVTPERVETLGRR
jgi:cell division septal protein FtsQ